MYQRYFEIVEEPEPHPVTRAELQERAHDQVDTAMHKMEVADEIGDQARSDDWFTVAACFRAAAVKFGIW